MWPKVKTFLLKYELLIFILCLVAILRLPSLMEPYWYGDEGIYLTLGQGIRHGLVLYRDIHDNKPPGIYLIAALAGTQFWFRTILLFWNLASIAVFSWIAAKLIPQKNLKPIKLFKVDFPRPGLATLATLIFGLSFFFFEGNIANGEIFMVLPTLVGFALLWSRRDQKAAGRCRLLAAAAGVSFSLAFLIKVPSIFDAIAAGMFFFLYPMGEKKIGKNIISMLRGFLRLDAWIFGVSFILPILVTVAYYWAMGAGKAYVGAALLQNIGYLSSWATGTQQSASLGKTGLSGRGLGLLAASGILLLTPAISETVVMVLLWLAFALFGALLSERPYPHYLIQILPPITLVFTLILGRIPKQLKHLQTRLEFGLLVLGLAVVAIGMVVFKFWSYPLLPYYANYIKFVTKQETRDQYFSYFDAHLPEEYSLAAFIVTYTSPNDRIFVWGDLPSMYALTRRLPPGRFTARYHIVDFNAFEETYAAILKVQPRFILIDKRVPPFTQIQGLLSDEYAPLYDSPTFTLYRFMPVGKTQ